MKLKSLNVIILVLLLLFSLSGCFFSQKEASVGQQAYTAAVNKLTGSNFRATITGSVTIETGEQTLSQNSVATVFVTNFKTPDMRVKTEATISSAEHSFSNIEVFIDGITYLDINGGFFSTSQTDAEQAIRYLSPALFIPSDYGNMQYRHESRKQIIGFTQPSTELFSILPEGACLIDSTASAILQADGTLYESTVSTEYTYGDATIACSTTARFHAHDGSAISKPNEADKYIAIANTDTLLQLETACIKLLGAPVKASDSTYEIFCQAGGLQRIQNTTTVVTEAPDGLSAQVDTQIDLINQNLHGTVETQAQTETFSNGKYTITANNSNTPTSTVTEDTMRSYCQNNLVSCVMLPQYVIAVDTTETQDTIFLSFKANEDLAKHLFSAAHQSLYADQAMTDQIMGSYKTQSISGYIEISKYTGLPIGAGLNYLGATSIDETSHEFRVNVEQVYSYAK